MIGVGSGSTSAIAIQAIAERVRSEGLNVTAICTSAEVTLAVRAFDLPVGFAVAAAAGLGIRRRG